MIEHVLWSAVAVVCAVNAVMGLSLVEWWLTKRGAK